MTKKSSRGVGRRILAVREKGWVVDLLIEFGESSQYRIGDAKCVCVLSRCTVYVLFPTEHHRLPQRHLCVSCHSRNLSCSPRRDDQAYEQRRRDSKPCRLQLPLNSHPEFCIHFFRVSIHASVVTDSSRMSLGMATPHTGRFLRQKRTSLVRRNWQGRFQHSKATMSDFKNTIKWQSLSIQVAHSTTSKCLFRLALMKVRQSSAQDQARQHCLATTSKEVAHFQRASR